MPTKKKRHARNLAEKGRKGRTKAIKKKTKGKNHRKLNKIKHEYGKYTTLTPEGRKAFLKTVKGIV